MAAVYRGVDLELDRTVAVKLLHSHLAADDRAQQRFQSEARYAARLAHPNLVTIFDFGIDQQPFIVMEWVDGGSLRDRLNQGPLPLAEALHIVDAVCAGLTVVHDAGLVHRDIKPENILVTRNGPKVADFGIARTLADPGLTPTGQILGSPHYLAPEVVRGDDPAPASDQYAVGVLVFELLTGRVPLPAAVPEAILVRHALEPVPPPSGVRPQVPAGVDAAVARATAMDPSHRYPSVAELSAALRATIDRAPAGAATRVRSAPFDATAAARRPPDGQPVDPMLPGHTRRPRRPRRRRRILTWVVLAVVIVAALSALRGDRSDSTASADTARADVDAATINDQVADGSLSFTVTGFTCIGRRLDNATARGRFCRLTLEATNIGDEPHAMVAGMQRLIDARDREHKPDDAATIKANVGRDLKIWLGELNPGQTASGSLIFDIPTGAKPVVVRLHDGPISRGAVVRLR
jgi:serine/threonine-protein kinase